MAQYKVIKSYCGIPAGSVVTLSAEFSTIPYMVANGYLEEIIKKKPKKAAIETKARKSLKK